jgi:hypothetical protein
MSRKKSKFLEEKEEIYVPPVKKHVISYVIFLKRNYDKKEAHEWCERNGFAHNVVEVLEDRYIFPQGDKEVSSIPQGRGIYFT